MDEISLEDLKQKFIFYLERNEFERSLIFLEKIINISNSEAESSALVKHKNALVSLEYFSYEDFKTRFLKYNTLSLEVTVLCVKYFIQLKQFIEKNIFIYWAEKKLFFNCFKTLFSMYKPSEIYCEKEGEKALRRIDIVYIFFDIYCLSQKHCIIDTKYFEYLELVNEFEEISKKRSEYIDSLNIDPFDWNAEYIDTTMPDSLLTEKERNLRKMMTYKENYKVNFSPFNGKILSEIIKDSPRQFLDLLINLHHFSVFEFTLMDENLMKCDNFLRAFTKNRIKRLYQIEQNKISIELEKEDNFNRKLEEESEEDYYNSINEKHNILDAFEGDSSNMWNVD